MRNGMVCYSNVTCKALLWHGAASTNTANDEVIAAVYGSARTAPVET